MHMSGNRTMHLTLNRLISQSPGMQALLPCLTKSQDRLQHNKATAMTVGNVSPELEVPAEIPKPPYVNASFMSSIISKCKKSRKIDVKTEAQIQGMRSSCSLARDILSAAGEYARPGITTDAIDKYVHKLCTDNGAYPSPLLYRGFPKSVCTSVNNVVCHGIPDDQPLQDGDIINIDITVFYKGFHGDTSATFPVGSVLSDDRHLIEVAKVCRDDAINICGPQVPFRRIGTTISSLSQESGYEVVPEFCGHGIGEYFHGPPDIIHTSDYPMKGLMKEGNTFTIEPVLCAGNPDIRILKDGWTAVTKDGSWSAQFEHTLLITKHGVEILTA